MTEINKPPADGEAAKEVLSQSPFPIPARPVGRPPKAATEVVAQEPAVQAPVAQAPPLAISPTLQGLLEMLIRREAREAAAEEKKLESQAQKDRQHAKNAESSAEGFHDKQRNCKHLKGGKKRLRTQAKDYAVYLHTFINSKRHIKCFLCNMKWLPADTKEFLYRGGKKIPNHTGLGWEDAILMAAESSNMASSSEIPMNATPIGITEEEI